MEHKQIGNLTEIKCIAAFMELGYTISLPYGDNAPYDFIADINGKLIRVQVKTAQINDDTIYIPCHHGQSNQYYQEDELDYFATYANEKCYLIPAKECNTGKRLRLTLPKNNQNKGINFAKDYELSVQLPL